MTRVNKITGQKMLSPATNKPIPAAIKAKAIAAKILNAIIKPTTTNIATMPVNNRIDVIGSKLCSAKVTCKSNHWLARCPRLYVNTIAINTARIIFLNITHSLSACDKKCSSDISDSGNSRKYYQTYHRNYAH
jgi:hypothetical protein